MFELQRLLAKSRELPSTWVVDVGAIARRVAEHEKGGVKGSAIWDLLAETNARSHRIFAWVQSMPGEFPGSFSTAELALASTELLAWLPPDRIWIQSNETFISLASSIQGDFGVVAIDIAYYEEQLYVLNWQPTALIDVVTGFVHTYPKDSTDSSNAGRSSRNKQPNKVYEPVFAPNVAATSLRNPQDPKKRRLGGKRAPNYKHELNVALQEHGTMLKAQVPRDVADKLKENEAAIEAGCGALLGNGVRDEQARQALQQFVTASRPTITISSGSTLTTDPIVIVPLVTGPNGSIAAQAWTNLTVFVGGRHVAGALPINDDVTKALTELVRKFPNRWIAPRALDLARYMLSLGIELPKRLFDPALGVYALNPDHMKQTLAGLQNAGELLPREAAWLLDIKRKTAPPNQLLQVDASITLLVEEIEQQLANAGLTKLFQNDLELTLPVLARIEQHGAWVVSGGASSPDAELARLQRRLTELERNFPKKLGDIERYRSKPRELVEALYKAKLTIAPQYSATYLNYGDVWERFAHAYPSVQALKDARSLVSLFPYLEAMMGNSRLRGLLTPQRSGRFGYRALALGKLPKHFPEAKRVRQLLGPPPGYRLVGVDISSFELRLVAGLSRDPVLLQAAVQQDSFRHLAQHFFGPSAGSIERSLTKRYIHAINYGQTKQGFVGDACFDLETADAEARYEAIQTAFPGLLRWRKAQAQFAKSSGYVATTRGWTRDVSSVRNYAKRQNIVCSTLAQGLAADIFRWCLCELDRLLPQLDSFIVFQNHDEVFIAAPLDQVDNVKQLALRVFEQDVATQTSLIPNGVQLKCKVKDGETWADLI